MFGQYCASVILFLGWFDHIIVPVSPYKHQESHPAFALKSSRRMESVQVIQQKNKASSTSLLRNMQEGEGTSDREILLNELLEWVKESSDNDNENKEENVPPPGFLGPLSIGASTVGQGDGLFVTQPVSKNDYLMVIPETKCISLEDAWEDEELGDVFCFLTDEGGPGARTAALAGLLAKEWLQMKNYGTLSSNKWDPYLRILPWTESDHGQEHILWWSKEKVENLLGDSYAYDEASSTLNEVEVAIENLQAMLLQEPDLHLEWDPENLITNENDIDHTVRSAFVSILSRAFEDDPVDCSKLVPLLDMAQHDGDGGANIHHETIPSTGNVIVKATRNIDAGEELLINYSSKLEPYQFFTVFGFVPGETSSIQELLKNKSPTFFSS